MSGHHLSAIPRTRSVSLLNPLVDAMTASKIPAFCHVGLCKRDIFVAQDLKAEVAFLHPGKETLKDRAFKSGGEDSESYMDVVKQGF